MGCCVSSKQEPITPLQIPTKPLQEDYIASQNCDNIISIPQKPALKIQEVFEPQALQIRQDFLPQKFVNEINKNNTSDKQITNMTEKLMSQFSISEKISNLLQFLCYTEEELIDICNAIVNAFSEILNGESAQEKKNINNIFSQAVKKQIKEEKVFYKDLVQQWQNFKKDQKPKQAHYSRIFHTIANLARNPKQKQVYEELSVDKINEIVELEHIQNQIQNLGQTVYFNYLQIEQQSKQINNFLLYCFTNHGKYLSSLNYELDEEQALKIAKISRQACEYHAEGIYILLVYFVRCCHKLQAKKIEIRQIEQKSKQILQKISKIYPPGEGLNTSQLLQSQLKAIQMKSAFKSKQTKLTAQTNKRTQLEQIIIENAKLAQRNRTDFQNLIREVCLKKSIAFKSGLKYNPDNPNQKAMTRIQEKMFFKNKKIQRKNYPNIATTLKQEQIQYKKNIEKTLSEITQVEFSISDMIRAKCIFSTLEDIIQTINDLKHFISQANTASELKYQIIQIESRFTRNPPISDITLKIVLNQSIVSQLQLTLQSNLAAYNFAHKIYQLNRSLIFSKVKIIHNYFEESRSQFEQLVTRKLELVSRKEGEDKQFKQIQSDIRKYFGIEEKARARSFKQALKNSVEQRMESLKGLESKKLKNFQPLINLTFNRKMQRNQVKIALTLKEFLQKQSKYSVIFRALMIMQLLKEIDMTKNYEKLKLQYYSFFKYGIDELGISLQGYKDQLKCSARIFIKIKEHDELYRIGYNNPYLFDFHQQSIENIYGKQSFETAESLIKQGKMYQNKQNYQKAGKYYSNSIQIIQKISQKNKNKDIALAPAIKLLMAQLFLKQNKTNKAKQYLKQIQGIFKAKQQNDNVILCQLLLAECAIKQNQMENFKQIHQQVVDTSKLHGISLQGEYIAEAYWRIGKKFMELGKENKDDELLKISLDNYFRKALFQFGGYMGWNNIHKKMKQVWKEYEALQLQIPVLKQNLLVKEIKIKGSKLSSQACLYMSKLRLPNLVSLVLQNNDITKQGCEHLASGDWPNLSYLNLSENKIKNGGIEKLCKAKWPLIQLKLWNNSISNQILAQDMLKQSFPKADIYV